MKLLSQLLALLFVSATALQIIFSIGTVVVILKLTFDRLKTAKSGWLDRKRRRDFENNVWAID